MSRNEETRMVYFCARDFRTGSIESREGAALRWISISVAKLVMPESWNNTRQTAVRIVQNNNDLCTLHCRNITQFTRDRPSIVAWRLRPYIF